jgi:hypothetical protein
MSFYRFSRSASDDCEDKGDENETVFHIRIPSLTISVCPGLRRWAVTKITEMLVSDTAFCVRPRTSSVLPFGAVGGQLRLAAGTAAQSSVASPW